MYITKICNDCKLELPLLKFSKHSKSKDKLRSKCRDCAKKYRQENKQAFSEYDKKYYESNKDKITEYRKINRDRILNYKKEYQKSNPVKSAVKTAKRRANKLMATPKWMTKQDFEKIEEIYNKARNLNSLTGIEHHVDHIVPLQGKNVCGLHVPWNLQILTATENLRKSNIFE